MLQTVAELTRAVLEEFLDGIVAALPRLFSGLLFFLIAYLIIKFVRIAVRSSLTRIYPSDQQLIVDFIVLVAGVFLWFGAGLALLKIVGLGEIAASLGTAAGFIALGISYALSNMIADTVAGIYLLRDPDFNPGDRVTAESTTGTVTDIGLRKSRIELDNGDRLILANRDIEKKWTKIAIGSDAQAE
jgi:small-conductance mechanosensitive channel